ncbi:MAG: hypothetical protein IKB76_06830 [Kiritimatiellae bacterium]|nr:hypothetical protein [Kiritimatiellia bacterium]
MVRARQRRGFRLVLSGVIDSIREFAALAEQADGIALLGFKRKGKVEDK